MKKRLYCADMGATSIKTGLYSFNGKRLKLENSIVFDNTPVYLHPALYWNFLSLYASVMEGLAAFAAKTKNISSIGIDTWGASFGFLNKKGLLAEPVFHYRDLRTKNILQTMETICNKQDLFYETGCCPARSYSLPQLVSIIKANDDIIKKASAILFLPDIISYFLCGEKTTELTFAGTTALLDIKKSVWSKFILDTFKIPAALFTEIIPPGTIKGNLLPIVAEHYNADPNIKVVSVCSHDTASAVTSIPGFDENSVYISFGTNINMGVETSVPCLSKEVFRLGFKNTGGFGGVNLLYKDFAAGWFINKLQKSIENKESFSFDAINKQVKKVLNESYIDVEDSELNDDVSQIKNNIDMYLQKTQQKPLSSDAEYMSCIYESIVLKIKHTINGFQKIFNNKFTKLYIISGGSKNQFLSQLICDALGMPVLIGNPNASLLGNALTQLYALGDLGSITEMREVSSLSCRIKELYPCREGKEKWDEKLAMYNRNCIL